MLSNVNNCSCRTASSLKNVIMNLILVTFLFIHVQRIESSPDYQSLHEQLSLREKLSKINTRNAIKASAPIVARVGKVFRHSLDKFTSQSHGSQPTKIHISKLKEESLPNWLTYNFHSNKLVGIPMKEDVGKIDLVIKISVKNVITTKKFQLEVREMRQQPLCHDGSPSSTAAAILNGDIKNFNGKGRVKLLRKFADYLGVEMNELNMAERKNEDLFDSSIITAGPGDRMPGKRQTGIVITWPVACGLGVPGDITINKLKHSSGNKHMYERVGLSFIGWYVYKNQYRFRRQAFPAATPVATPAPSVPVPKTVTSIISGTPVISPTPSMIVKTTSSVIKATVVTLKPTPAPVTKPVTTKQPTTKPPTTKMKTTEKPVTTKKTTEKPKKTDKVVPVTTKEPEKTTMKPKTTTMKPEKTTMEPKKTTMEPETTTMKPEKTTMEPKKTTMKPKTTTMKPKKTTMKPKMTTEMKKPMTVKPTRKDEKPRRINSIDLIALYASQAYKLKIERDLFEDDIDGDTYNLTLSLKKVVSQTLTDVDISWIYLDTVGKFLYVIPNLSHVGDNSFAIQATDSSGNTQNAVFNVKVADENKSYNNLFNVTIDADFKTFTSNAMNKVELIESIAKATGVGYQKMRTQKFYSGSVIINYASADLSNEDGCNSIKAQQYKAKLESSEFKDAMAPKYIVLKTSAKNMAPDCGLTNARKSPTGQPKNEYKWWEVVLIPVIVIAVLLLVIGLIFFFLYRRKRRYEPQKEDKNTFLYQKKPVIFREEYQEKPDVMSLEPLILPNEKAPVPMSADEYQPRTSTPDGNGSSSASTENDEKALIDKSTPPQTPVHQSPPRSPPYGRSPPPYSEP